MASIINATTTNGLSTSADNSGSLQLATNNGTTAVTIDTSQNVGIGTTSPQSKLETTVSNGTHRLGVNSSDTNYNIRANSGSNCSITWTESGQADRWTVGCVTGQNYLAFRSNSSNMGNGDERMRINSSGDLLFNCTGKTNDAPNNAGGRINETNGNEKVRVSSDGLGAFQFYSPSGGTSSPVGQISVNASSTSYGTSSDYRLKENIAPMTGALAKVTQLKPCTYTWKANGIAGEGFIAHELAEVCPDAVSGEKDAVNEDGSIKPQGIDTSFLVATLTAALQELNAKVEAQAVRIAELEGAK